jgi:hypothetical protein
MIKGFSMLEVIVALTIGLGILVLVISNVSEATVHTKRIVSNQEKMESIFHTVEMIRSDLTKCGMRLQEPAKFSGFPLFDNSDISFKVTYGIGDELLIEDSIVNESLVAINSSDYFKKGKKIVIYDPDNKNYEINEIKSTRGDQLFLAKALESDYPKNSAVVAVKEVEYKLYTDQNILKRKVNKGYFQPLIEGVTDFYVKYFPESFSLFYRIEINKKEQVRGYIYMTNMVMK